LTVTPNFANYVLSSHCPTPCTAPKLHFIVNYGVLESLQSPIAIIRPSQQRQQTHEIERFKKSLVSLRKSLRIDDEKIDAEAVQNFSGRTIKVTRTTDYEISSFQNLKLTISLSKTTVKSTLRAKKWEKLKALSISLNYKGIIWRVWHNCLITLKIANLMGLMSNSSCPYCLALSQDCNILFFVTLQITCGHVWSLIESSGQNLVNRDRNYGFPKPSYVNDLVYITICLLYMRFLYNINSGRQDYDLIDKYKFRINELLYSQFYVAKYTNSLPSFVNYWNKGRGLFEIRDYQLVVRLP